MVKGSPMCLHLCSSSLEPKFFLVFNVNGVLCYFPPPIVLQGNARVFGKYVDKTKVEIRTRVENFLSKAFQNFHIAIWSCMKLEDVLEVLSMLMPKSFLNRFVFI
jgi:hypothetical protein